MVTRIEKITIVRQKILIEFKKKSNPKLSHRQRQQFGIAPN